MTTCPSCGEKNPERAKFCLECGTALERTQAVAEERKVVTVRRHGEKFIGDAVMAVFGAPVGDPTGSVSLTRLHLPGGELESLPKLLHIGLACPRPAPNVLREHSRTVGQAGVLPPVSLGPELRSPVRG
jgi:class 3 adenylate cyclase